MSKMAGAVAGSRPRHTTARTPRHPNLRVLIVLTACLVWFGAVSVAEATESDDLVKVFVVPDPARSGGEIATLPSVAADTLGDASRSTEIFELNQGQAQLDGAALNDPGEQLHPGWILRLPQDATGKGVQLARDNDGPEPAAGPAPGGSAATSVFVIPLGTVLAVLGAILLALATACIVARRRLRAAYVALTRAIHRLGEPLRARRRLRARRMLGRRFAADTDSVHRAHGILNQFADSEGGPEIAVHAVSLDAVGATVWLPSSATAPPQWTSLDTTRWRMTGTDDRQTEGNRTPDTAACLVRVGTDVEGAQVFVDLSRLDGVLSIAGDAGVARDVVQNVLYEVARSRPGTPVIILRDRAGESVPVLVPGLRQVSQAAVPTPTAAASTGTTRLAVARRPLKGLVVLAAPPTDQEAAQFAALCGIGGAGWTGLVCGEMDAAHWRWYAHAEGQVDIPVLDVHLTAPA
ncbi:hypothetical protein FB570_11711 [Streptomyces sp. T12]|uniref:hypothetical protein n=1 Tax=Streptomyces sp. T12 TaxID=477697 RepID=UPI0011A8C5F9|nr:hypothetical protein [Streptomyces sp. T12]TWD13519.1 hypothetical protein FB570_11711 [Streptomyces sp. T12]